MTAYQLTTKFPGRCSRCSSAIGQGARAVYLPHTRALLCLVRPECGRAQLEAQRKPRAPSARRWYADA